MLYGVSIAITASTAGAFTQDLCFGDQADARAKARADAKGDARRIIFCNDTIKAPRGEMIDGEAIGQEPDLGVRMQDLNRGHK
jgi:hypothetical protein